MGFDDDIAILAASPVLGLFDPGALRLLTFAGERIALAGDETLFRRGDRADCGYVVLSGTVLLRGVPDAAPVAAGPSALIGRNALFAMGTRPAEARAQGPAEVMRISTQLMTRVLREFPEAAAAVHDWLAADLRDLTRGLGAVRVRLLGGQAP